MRPRALLVTAIALAGCVNEYHPEYHPETSFTYVQNVTYSTVVESPPIVVQGVVVPRVPTVAATRSSARSSGAAVPVPSSRVTALADVPAVPRMVRYRSWP